VAGFCKVCAFVPTHGQMKQLSLLLLVLTLALPASAQTKTLLNLDRNGVAIQGHDPVAYFTEGKPVKGKSEFTSKRNGATYVFASKEHKELFDMNPEKYEPAFGGYCAYGVSKNTLAPIEVDAFQIVGGRLLLQYDKGVRDQFNRNTQGNLAKANANWPGLVARKGK
jgi:YHS domain-containing protein